MRAQPTERAKKLSNEFVDAHPKKREWSLAPMQALCKKLGLEPAGFKCLQVAGTNGKGSVAALASQILLEQGCVVGTFTSPHLLDVRERITIGGEKIPEKTFSELSSKVSAADKQLPHGLETSFFEQLTATALLHFKEQETEFVVAEVGLGGRLDSTNLLEPLVAVITNVSLEHTELLGSTEREIAREKAGIVKKNSLTVTGAEGDALDEVRKACLEKNSGLHVVPQKQLKAVECTAFGTHFEFEGKKYFTRLLGPHQAHNAAIAVKAVELLGKRGFKVGRQAIEAGLERTEWPGRLQVISGNPVTVLDGAHNPAAARALATAVNAIWPGRQVVLVLGILRDKDAQAILGQLAMMRVKKVFVSAPKTRRAIPAPQLGEKAVKLFGSSKAEAEPNLAQALEKARETAAENGLVLATGSLYSVAELLRNLQGGHAM